MVGTDWDRKSTFGATALGVTDFGATALGDTDFGTTAFETGYRDKGGTIDIFISLNVNNRTNVQPLAMKS